MIVAVVVVVITVARDDGGPLDAIAWDPDRREQLEANAATGLSHVLYVKSPGGVIASVERTAGFRPLIEDIAVEAGIDPDIMEAIVFLESGGRQDARASDDPEAASGLTQILAGTATDLLEMKVDLDESARLTRAIAAGEDLARNRARRAEVDERFDPQKALRGTARYLTFARDRLGRDDLAVVSYHMGVGNLQTALERYGDTGISYAQLFFDSTPLRHAEAWSTLAALGDDSATYYWKVLAARQIMRLARKDRSELDRLIGLHRSAPSAERVLHPPEETPAFDSPEVVQRAVADGQLRELSAERLEGAGIAIDPGMPAASRWLRPRALEVLELIGAGVREISGFSPLRVTSALGGVHPTGYAFDIARDYAAPKQAEAFQFMLDRLTALDRIAFSRAGDVIRIVVR